jgi:Flp pilus assembly protein TadG
MKMPFNVGQRLFSRFGRPRRGASVLEFVLVAPILFMLGFGIVDYGQFFYVKNTVQGAANTAARVAISATATQSDVTTTISNILSAANLQNSGYTVTTSPTSITSAAAGTPVTVTINITWSHVGFHTLASGYGGISNSKVIKGTATMRKEGT